MTWKAIQPETMRVCLTTRGDRQLIGAVISVSAPISAARNIRRRGTRDGGNIGWRYKRYKLDVERHRADTKGMYRGRAGKAGNVSCSSSNWSFRNHYMQGGNHE